MKHVSATPWAQIAHLPNTLFSRISEHTQHISWLAITSFDLIGKWGILGCLMTVFRVPGWGSRARTRTDGRWPHVDLSIESLLGNLGAWVRGTDWDGSINTKIYLLLMMHSASLRVHLLISFHKRRFVDPLFAASRIYLRLTTVIVSHSFLFLAFSYFNFYVKFIAL